VSTTVLPERSEVMGMGAWVIRGPRSLAGGGVVVDDPPAFGAFLEEEGEEAVRRVLRAVEPPATEHDGPPRREHLHVEAVEAERAHGGPVGVAALVGVER